MNMMPRRIPQKLKLGEYYNTQWGTFDGRKGKPFNTRFIQPTEKGFNFLDLETAKCILPHHLYPSKHANHTQNNETWFWLNEYFKVKKT
jgi:hypothetical protein